MKAVKEKKLQPFLISIINGCDQTDVGTNNADITSTTFNPNSVIKTTKQQQYEKTQLKTKLRK